MYSRRQQAVRRLQNKVVTRSYPSLCIGTRAVFVFRFFAVLCGSLTVPAVRRRTDAQRFYVLFCTDRTSTAHCQLMICGL